MLGVDEGGYSGAMAQAGISQVADAPWRVNANRSLWLTRHKNREHNENHNQGADAKRYGILTGVRIH
jgi:hypothetical protein